MCGVGCGRVVFSVCYTYLGFFGPAGFGRVRVGRSYCGAWVRGALLKRADLVVLGQCVFFFFGRRVGARFNHLFNVAPRGGKFLVVELGLWVIFLKASPCLHVSGCAVACVFAGASGDLYGASTETLTTRLQRFMSTLFVQLSARAAHVLQDWILTTNHRRIAVLYFGFVALAGFTGLVLATIIRLELAYPGQFWLAQNAEKYLTLISLHGVVMVFFMIIPVIFGAFGNFLLPTQLGIRDVAFPRLNSFMF